MTSINDQGLQAPGAIEAPQNLDKRLEAGSLGAGPKRPRRTCLGCRARRDQRELRRLALAPGSSKVIWDPDRRLGGRGAWLCRDRAECLNLALKKRALLRAFRLQAEPDLTEIKAGLVPDEKK